MFVPNIIGAPERKRLYVHIGHFRQAKLLRPCFCSTKYRGAHNAEENEIVPWSHIPNKFLERTFHYQLTSQHALASMKPKKIPSCSPCGCHLRLLSMATIFSSHGFMPEEEYGLSTGNDLLSAQLLKTYHGAVWLERAFSGVNGNGWSLIWVQSTSEFDPGD